MAFRKGDCVLLIEGTKESGYKLSKQDVSSGANGKVVLTGRADEFTQKGKHKTKSDSTIVPIPAFADPKKSQSIFVKSCKSVGGISISDDAVEELLALTNEV